MGRKRYSQRRRTLFSARLISRLPTNTAIQPQQEDLEFTLSPNQLQRRKALEPMSNQQAERHWQIEQEDAVDCVAMDVRDKSADEMNKSYGF